MITIIPLDGLPEVRPGADLAAMLRRDFEAGDILVITQKIVSKADNLFVDLATVTPDAAALALAAVTRKDPRLVALVLRESTAVVRAVPHVLITRHHCGCVMANAGIDQSNIGDGDADRVLLLPRDPDHSAARLRTALGVSAPAVVISDSFGRPWRYGVVNIAIGAAGLPALIDRRGNLDRNGRPMEVTQIALADLIASAAGLAMGEGSEGIPAVIIRGMTLDAPMAPASSLIRPLSEDLFQ
ncbi:coenzyme F420-0:L-glutamate ligase [Sphingomonas sp. 28-63-12]|uniref:coenzyme F420-0:L-glutamate ligase n=1 Tax=Sphingomonas sp. 28-63-12 TaxID=1970434 RepID=UPI000BDB36DF|nr:MAG: coenzyme F420-0:L-glutamate ligase [Sphingomonas sp. 28-63-12]